MGIIKRSRPFEPSSIDVFHLSCSPWTISWYFTLMLGVAGITSLGSHAVRYPQWGIFFTSWMSYYRLIDDNWLQIRGSTGSVSFGAWYCSVFRWVIILSFHFFLCKRNVHRERLYWRYVERHLSPFIDPRIIGNESVTHEMSKSDRFWVRHGTLTLRD